VIRVLIADDEPLAREGLRLRLEREADVSIVAEAASGTEAAEAIRREQPDLAFLDVQMPGCDGFEALERASQAHLPEVVFVTAFDRHAIRAFEVHALDYLLKPVQDARFAEALRRARAELARGGERESPARLGALLDSRGDSAPAPSASRLRRFAVRDRDRFLLVPAHDVRWIRSAGNYAELHLADSTLLVRITFADLERQLDPELFARVHRTVIVRQDLVREVVPTPHGDFEIVLDQGEPLPMSRGYRGRLLPAK